jgi:uncharacterized repeat protein (TIGR03803 family)
MREMQVRLSMNYVQRAGKSLRIGTVLVLVVFVGVVTGPAIPAQAQTYTDLHDFNAAGGDPTNFNSGKLAQARDGNFYAESRNGGVSNQGAVFKVTPGGMVSLVYSFNGTTGSNATGGMTLGPSDGNLYGDTFSGGTSNDGVTFKVTPSGTYTALHNFLNTGDGVAPVNALVVGSNGNFYGLTDSNPETFYEITSAGKLTTLHTFSTAEGYQGGQLTLGSDGNFYGGLNLGGLNGNGTAFKVSAAGKVTVLHNFNGTDGNDEATGMVQAPNGFFYGSASLGGANGAGVIYKLSSAGAYTLLHSLNASTDGSLVGVLLLATDGNIYGTAINSGASNCGTVFKVTTAVVFSVIHSFDNTHGCNPEGYLTQGTGGKLYGLTNNGGAHGNGVFFSLDLGLAPFILLQSTSGRVGSKVGIIGQGFDNTSVGKFNGATATTTTLTGTTYITATVPTGATDGFVTVTTGSTTLTSTQKYIVHNSWGSGKAIPTAIFGPGGVAVLSNQIYVIGGVNAANTVIADTQIYNPTTNTWSTGVSLPTPTAGGAAAAVNGVLYVIGGSSTADGSTQTNAVWAYSPKTKSWSAKAAMPTAREGAPAVVENNIIYVIGGYANGNRLNTLESYNPATDTWKEEAPLISGKSDPSAGVVGTTIVAADGYTSSGGDNGDNEGYNASSNSWTSFKADPTPRNGACGGGIGPQMYVAGGYQGGPALDLTESFTVSTNTWKTLAPMPQATVSPGSAVYKGQLYCIGGSTAQPGTVLSNVQIYQP